MEDKKICLSADEARELSTSKNSQVCQAIMKRANGAIRDAAVSHGDNNCYIVLYAHEKEAAIKFAVSWLQELGYKIVWKSNMLKISWATKE